MKKTIYPTRSQATETILTDVDLRKVLIVPIDFAKEIHEAQFCRATGEYLLSQPLHVHNTIRGLDFLNDKINKCCGKHGIDRSSVLICGEDPTSFSANFIHGLKGRGLEFVRVNAKEAKKLRLSSRASTNALDLNGIAQAAIHRRAYDPMDYSSIYTSLKHASRARRQLVNQMSMVKNQIHQNIDVLFPGFLKESVTGLQPFSEACLSLLEDNLSIKKIRRMSHDKLTERLRKHRLKSPGTIANAIKELATTAAPPPKSLSSIMSDSLKSYTELLRQQIKSIELVENNGMCLLVQTPCFMLLTTTGVGPVSAMEITGELGDPATWNPAKEIASYAGIVSRIKGTGAPDKAPTVLSLPIDCNKRLKNALMTVAKNTGRNRHPIRKVMKGHIGEHPLRKHFNKKEAENGRSLLSTAKRFVKCMPALVHQQTPYMSTGLKPESLEESIEFLRIEMMAAILTLEDIAKRYDLSSVPEDNNLMNKWIKKCQADFDIK